MLKEQNRLDAKSIALRKKIIQVLCQANRGHLASALSIVEILRVLYDDILRYNCRDPYWPERDRFILSKGHGCLSLYVILAEKAFFPESELWNFCKLDGILGGHPEPKIPGIEFSTGSLGHGLSVGIGMALNAKYEKRQNKIYVLLGDGECNEGSVWEAAMSAHKHKLDNLVVMIDYNKYQSYGTTREVLDLEPFTDKWKSFGFSTTEVDGHDVGALKKVLGSVPFEAGKPSAIICHTVKGKGIHFIENDMQWHHLSKVNETDARALLKALEEYECVKHV
jgi:transketolase